MKASTTEFFGLYDYGQGGLWIRITARSADEIRQKYPFLTVFDAQPNWMGADIYNRLETLDIEQPPKGWLAQVMKEKQ